MMIEERNGRASNLEPFYYGPNRGVHFIDFTGAPKGSAAVQENQRASGKRDK